MVRRETVGEFTEAELVETAGGVDQHIAGGIEAAEQVHLVEQSGVLDDQRVRCHHRLAQPDFLLINSAERHHRRAHTFRAEAGEGLGVLAFEEGGDRQYLGARNHALAAPAVYAHLEHATRSSRPVPGLPSVDLPWPTKPSALTRSRDRVRCENLSNLRLGGL